LLLADTGADMMKLIGAFLQLSVTNAPKNNWLSSILVEDTEKITSSGKAFDIQTFPTSVGHGVSWLVTSIICLGDSTRLRTWFVVQSLPINPSSLRIHIILSHCCLYMAIDQGNLCLNRISEEENPFFSCQNSPCSINVTDEHRILILEYLWSSEQQGWNANDQITAAGYKKFQTVLLILKLFSSVFAHSDIFFIYCKQKLCT
jgi:hypothetical protein